MQAEVVDAAKGLGDRAEGAGGVTVELRKLSLETLEVSAQDERAGSAFLREPSQLRLGDPAPRIVQHPVKPFLENGVELQPDLSHPGLGA